MNDLKPCPMCGSPAKFVPFPSFMRKRIEQAMEDAIHPKGMSVHDGKAKVLASDLHRMLLVIDFVLAQPEHNHFSDAMSVLADVNADLIAEAELAKLEQAAEIGKTL